MGTVGFRRGVKCGCFMKDPGDRRAFLAGIMCPQLAVGHCLPGVFASGRFRIVL